MNKILVVVNTCGIGIQEKIDVYIKNIRHLLGQNLDSYHIVLSSCLNNQETIDILREKFKNTISYNLITELLPVASTFNHSIIQTVKHFGEFEGYLYFSIGQFFEDEHGLRKLYESFKSGPYGLVSTWVDCDSAIHPWLVDDIQDEHKIFDREWSTVHGYQMDSHDNFIIPVGKCITLHSTLFSNDFFQYYNSRVMTDIFETWCSESVMSFMVAALKKKWIIAKNVPVKHLQRCDGGSLGYRKTMGMDVVYRLPKTIMEIIKPGVPYGMGYQERLCYDNVVMHDKSQFDEDGFCINDKLKEYIRNSLFLSQKYLDYNIIKHTFIPRGQDY